MSCYTQEEIAEREDVSQQEISKLLPQMAELPKVVKPAAEHLTDFDKKRSAIRSAGVENR